MNWKVFALVPALALATSLPAFSLTKDKTHHASATHVAQVSQPSHTMKKANSLQKTNTKHESSNTARRDSVIKIGSRGETVRNAQNELKKRGFYTASINGVFDNKTRTAVMKFQKSQGLKADGVLGNRTLAALK